MRSLVAVRIPPGRHTTRFPQGGQRELGVEAAPCVWTIVGAVRWQLTRVRRRADARTSPLVHETAAALTANDGAGSPNGVLVVLLTPSAGSVVEKRGYASSLDHAGVKGAFDAEVPETGHLHSIGWVGEHPGTGISPRTESVDVAIWPAATTDDIHVSITIAAALSWVSCTALTPVAGPTK